MFVMNDDKEKKHHDFMLEFQYPILSKIAGMSSETMLLLWSMKEKHNSDSKFKFYFDTLPEAFNTGIYHYI